MWYYSKEDDYTGPFDTSNIIQGNSVYVLRVFHLNNNCQQLRWNLNVMSRKFHQNEDIPVSVGYFLATAAEEYLNCEVYLIGIITYGSQHKHPSIYF